MKRSLVAGILLLLSMVEPAAGQDTSVKGRQAAPSKDKQDTAAKDKKDDDVVRISVTLVQVDAVVTDDKGRHVADLKPEDFEILEDGRAQKITNFSYITTQPAATAAPATAPAAADKNAPPAPPVRLRPDQVRRTIALVVDDLSMSFESTHFVREALKKFVDEQMQPGDLVAIIRTGAGMGALQQFTADKRLLRAAVERVRWNMTGRGGASAFAPIGGDPRDEELRRASEEVEQFREEIFSVGTLGALNFVVRGLRDLPGRKSVILVSDGFRLFNRDKDNYRVREALRRLADLSNRASVVIYTIDARGLQPLGPTAADDVSQMSPQQVEQQLSNRRDDFFETQQGLNYLAYETGGFFVRNTNDITRGINRALDDQKGYYLIGYIPDEATFRVERGRRKFHKISVRVKRAGLRVRSRTGFYGIADEDARPTRRTPGEQMMAALTSPFASGDIHLKLTSLFGHDPKAGSFMRSLMHIDARDISFIEEADGWHKSAIDIVAFTFGDNGQVIDRVSRSYNIRVRGDTYQKLINQGFVYTVIVPIKKAGAYQLRVAVRDSRTERIGSANQFIEVPDIGKRRLTLSGVVLMGTDPAVENKAPKDGNAPANQPVASEKENEEKFDDPQATPAVRRLRRGTFMDYYFAIYNPQVDKATGKPQLEAQVSLFRDGKQVFAGGQKPIEIDDGKDFKNIAAGGRIRLGGAMEPGEYVFQVVVTDKLAKEKQRTASRWIDFEIVR